MGSDLADVVAHYDEIREEDRLVGGIRELELVRTQAILRPRLPPAPARVLDLGGATGVHAAWLLDEGYDVHLVDLTPRHVEAALAALGARGLTAEVGDARRLAHPEGAFDAVLVMGPLYHLVEGADRLAALREALRVVRPGGLVAAAAISRYASLVDGLRRGFLFDPAFRSIVDRDLTDGRHENPDRRPHWFTTAYFHHPTELGDELAAAGLGSVEVLAVEGVAGWLTELGARWDDPVSQAVVLEALARVEAEPSLLGASSHLLGVGRAPTR